MKESERARCLGSIREINCVYCVQTSSPGCYSLGKVWLSFFLPTAKNAMETVKLEMDNLLLTLTHQFVEKLHFPMLFVADIK